MSNKNRALLFDLIFLSVICVIGEIINYKAVNSYSSGYYFSITMIIAFVAVYRLGYIGVLTSIAIGVAFYFINDGATIQTLIVYVVGNSFMIFAAIFLNIIGRERVKSNINWAILYVIIGYLSIIIGRGLVSWIVDTQMNLISALFLVLTNEFLSMIAVAMLFGLLARRKFLLIDLQQLYKETIEE